MKATHALLIAIGVIAAATWVQAAPTAGLAPALYTRACAPATGHPTSLSVSSSASTQLAKDNLYQITCTVDVWIEWGASAPTADSNSDTLRANDKFYFAVMPEGDTENDYVAAVDQAGASGTCKIVQCL